MIASEMASIVYETPPPPSEPTYSVPSPAYIATEVPRAEHKRTTKIKVDLSRFPIDSDGAQQICGRKIADQPIDISQVTAESGRVTIWGDIFQSESRTSRDGKTAIISYAITDYTSSIHLKVITDVKSAESYEKLKKDVTILVRGEVSYDKYDRDNVIRPTDIMVVKRKKRMDCAEEKRVELHLHTNMSAMDAVTSAKKLVSTAYELSLIHIWLLLVPFLVIR